jgi:protein phosphatase
MQLRFFALSEQANRETNDDFFAAEAAVGLFAVADGIGGRPGASSASRAAVAALLRRVSDIDPAERLQEARLREAVAAVNADVIAIGERDPRLSGLGTTLSALLLGEAEGCLVHLGDSRVYRLRDGALTRMTQDHTVANELVRLNRLRPDEVERHPLRGTLSRFLGSPSDADPDIHTFRTSPGECFLLATDGLSAVLPEADILRLGIEALPKGMEAVCRSLSAEALRRHPPDNVTVVAVEGGIPIRIPE